MKPLMHLPVLLFFVLPLSTLHAQYSAGGGLDYNVDVKRTGIFLRGEYQIRPNWSAALSFNYFIEGDSDVTKYEWALDAHRYFWEDGRRRVYFIGGLNLFHDRRNGAEENAVRKNNFGLSFGIGGQTELMPRVIPFSEVKVSVGDGSLFGMFLGVRYTL